MAPIRNTMTRAVERLTCLFDKGMRLAKKISRLEIDKLILIELVFLIILIDIARLCGARVLPLRKNVGRVGANASSTCFAARFKLCAMHLQSRQ